MATQSIPIATGKMKVVQPILLSACAGLMLLAAAHGQINPQSQLATPESGVRGTSPTAFPASNAPFRITVPGTDELPGIKKVGTPVQLTRIPKSVGSSPVNPLTATSGLPHQLLAEASVGDASLNSIAEISPDELCAVGNCGTILLTRDAGRSWSVVNTPTSHHLYDVIFFDGENGLAVGGSVGSYSGTSRGLLLRTGDSGRSWQLVDNDLPCLRGIKRVGEQTIAWGDYDTRRKSGVFISLDRGRNWNATGLQLGHVAVAGQPSSAEIIAFDTQARFTSSGNQRLDNLQHPSQSEQVAPLPTPRSLHFTGERWILCGDRGLLKFSLDGKQWQDLTVPLSSRAAIHCDWLSIDQSGSDLWICGNPGSLLLHSSDAGRTWKVMRTGQSLPLSKLCFVDRQRGWAVGPLGRILATRDGGTNWYSQRGRNRKTGLLSIAKEFQTIPWTSLASAAWESQITCVSIVAADNVQSNDSEFLPDASERLIDVSRGLGIELVHRRPRTTGSQATNSLIDMAVLVATWKPSVLLVDSSLAVTSQTIVENTSQATVSAVLDELGLRPARFQKLATTSTDNASHYTEHSQRVLKQIGLAAWDLLSRLPPETLLRSEAVPMRTLWSRTKNGASNASLLGAVALDTTVQRGALVSKIGNYQMVMGRVHRKRSLEALIKLDGDLASWRSDFEFIVQNLPPQELAPSLWKLANELRDVHDSKRRQLVLQRLSLQNANEDAAMWAMLELLKMLASDELHTWQASQSKPAGGSSASSVPTATAGVVTAEHLTQMPWNASPFTNPAETTAVITAAANKQLPQSSTSQSDTSAQAWFQLYGKCTQLEPRLLHRPDMQLMAYRMSRSQSNLAASEFKRLEDLLGAEQLPGWRQLALQEVQTARQNQSNTLDTIVVARADVRPLLDGQFNESFWTRSTPCRMTASRTAALASEVRLAYDEEYLYISAICPIADSTVLPALREKRNYDCDLTELDHLRIRIDTDRDYSSFFEFAVAADGGTLDACCGASQFNPKWHVLVKHSQQAWLAEIAIDLHHLTLDENLQGDRWAVSLQRVSNGQTVAGWARASSFSENPKPGLLNFEDTPPK